MSKQLNVRLSDQLSNAVDEVVKKYPYDYNSKKTIFVRGAIIRELRRMGTIK